MLLSVLCIVIVIAAVVAIGVYFGVIDKDKGVEGNYDNIKESLSNGVDNIKNHFDKLKE